MSAEITTATKPTTETRVPETVANSIPTQSQVSVENLYYLCPPMINLGLKQPRCDSIVRELLPSKGKMPIVFNFTGCCGQQVLLLGDFNPKCEKEVFFSYHSIVRCFYVL